MTSERVSWLESITDNGLRISVNTKLYSIEALFRVCYAFTDRCYLFLQADHDLSKVDVMFAPKDTDCSLHHVAAEFSNELINQKVRLDVASETRAIRELIVVQAFAEADFIDRSQSESSYIEDPKSITK